ncbi:hypothetical protein M3225_03680 [Priestia aryabhattai]|uniref:hypothetical protein n=1 Tax=Priestia aryabhattai TaxID=412384 RepID=UPI00203F80EF|nr:hypothetical protein [Priestia aryabhattai]MCM3769587.1 hypothetical protein [Priestia aryabhattai]
MKTFVFVLFTLVSTVTYPLQTHADKMPCTIALDPINKGLKNAKGSALIYEVQLKTSSIARTNISILGAHLPTPSSYGQYDSYEGYATIPNEISWRFRMYPTPEEDGPTWAGRFDLITADIKNVKVQVRLSNSKTEKLGPPVLQGVIKTCN